jgi:hypothetical protein
VRPAPFNWISQLLFLALRVSKSEMARPSPNCPAQKLTCFKGLAHLFSFIIISFLTQIDGLRSITTKALYRVIFYFQKKLEQIHVCLIRFVDIQDQSHRMLVLKSRERKVKQDIVLVRHVNRQRHEQVGVFSLDWLWLFR